MSLLSFLSPQIIAKVKSRFNGEISIVENFGEKIITVGNAQQSGGTITPMWNKAVTALFKRNRLLNSGLILGLGGGTVIGHLKKRYPQMKITAIEFDQVMIDVAGKYFGMENDNNLRIIKADAFNYVLNKIERDKFNLIVMDLFTGKYNPPESHSPEFLKKLRNFLKPGGYILFNSHYDAAKSDDLKILMQRCRQVFHFVAIVVEYKYSRILLLH